MARTIRILIAGLVLMMTAAPWAWAEEMTAEFRPLTGFRQVAMKCSGQLFVKEGRGFRVRVEAEADVLPRVTTEVKDGRLIIDREGLFGSGDPIKIWVTAPQFTRLSLFGSGDIISLSRLRSDKLTLDLKGSGAIELELAVDRLETTLTGSGRAAYKGTAGEQRFTVNGSGSLHAAGLATGTSVIVIRGSGKAEVSAAERLEVKIYGSGEVTYRGRPDKVEQKIYGSGRVIGRD